MSRTLDKDSLTEEEINYIRTKCYVQAKVTSFSQTSTYGATAQTPILFYKVAKDKIHLPYHFTNTIKPNDKTIDHYPLTHFDFKGNLLEHQISIIDEAEQQLQTFNTTLLAVYPSAGKTVMSAYLASKSNLLTLVLYNQKNLGVQWKKTFEDFTDAKLWIIGEKPPAEANVLLCMDTQFHKIPLEYRPNIGCVVIDEMHSFCTPGSVECLLGTQPFKLIGCTATPEREDNKHVMIHLMIGKHSVIRKTEKEFNVIRVLTGTKTSMVKNVRGDTDWCAVVNELCENEIRNSYILKFVRDNPKFKILILTWRKEHAFSLQQWLTEMDEKTAVMAGKCKSYSDSRILVGTTSKIGTGFDEKAACDDFDGNRLNMLLMVGSTKSTPLLEQLVGRVFRSQFPIVYDFVDDVSSIKSHFSIRKKWYQSLNCDIYDLNITKLLKVNNLDDLSFSYYDKSNISLLSKNIKNDKEDNNSVATNLAAKQLNLLNSKMLSNLKSNDESLDNKVVLSLAAKQIALYNAKH